MKAAGKWSLVTCRLHFAGRGYLHVIDLTGLYVASVLFCEVVFTLHLSLCACPDLFIIQRDRERQTWHQIKKHPTQPKQRLHKCPPSSDETPPASDEGIQMQPCGITQLTPHLQHLAVPCCLAAGHDVPAVAVGDETAICSQESHFALRQNRQNTGSSRLETQTPVFESGIRNGPVVDVKEYFPKGRAVMFSDES